MFLREFAPELQPGEELVWSGRPLQRFIFHREIRAYWLWSAFLVWLGISTWNRHATEGPGFTRWIDAFSAVFIGAFAAWNFIGPLLLERRRKRKILYAVTNRRVIVLYNERTRDIRSVLIAGIPKIEEDIRADGIGTLRFTTPPFFFRTGRLRLDGVVLPRSVFHPGGPLAFADIRDAAGVSLLIQALQPVVAS